MAYPPPGQPNDGPQQPYPPNQGYQGPYPPHAPAPRPTNGLAIAALVLGIAEFFVGVTFLPAIICGHLARRQIRRTGEQGDGMALAGLILGYIGAAMMIVVVLAIVFLLAHSTVSVSNSSVVVPGLPGPWPGN